MLFGYQCQRPPGSFGQPKPSSPKAVVLSRSNVAASNSAASSPRSASYTPGGTCSAVSPVCSAGASSGVARAISPPGPWGSFPRVVPVPSPPCLHPFGISPTPNRPTVIPPSRMLSFDSPLHPRLTRLPRPKSLSSTLTCALRASCATWGYSSSGLVPGKLNRWRCPAIHWCVSGLTGLAETLQRSK